MAGITIEEKFQLAKKGIGWNFYMKFRSQIENQVSDYRLLRASSFH
jgi:hypothetical protein